MNPSNLISLAGIAAVIYSFLSYNPNYTSQLSFDPRIKTVTPTPPSPVVSNNGVILSAIYE